MLDNLARVIESKDVNASPIGVPRPSLVAMQHDEVIVREHSPELNAFARILPRHPFEVLDERILAVGHRRVVLRVAGADVPPNRFGRLALVEHQVVEGDDG